MARTSLTAEERRFRKDGFVIVEALFSAEETALLRNIAHADPARRAISLGRDLGGRDVRLSLDHKLREDGYSAVVRSRRVVSRVETFLGKPAQFFHFKVIEKEPHKGGAWEWHQDFGYWYTHSGYLYPDLVSCLVALDPATTHNGCVQVLRGSHHMGRIDHAAAPQIRADPQRTAAAARLHEQVMCELKPGGALFFHCNLLHSSAPNLSADPRWAFISCFSSVGNRTIQALDAPEERVVALPDKQVLPALQQHWDLLHGCE